MTFKKEYLILGLVIAALVAYLVFRNTDRTHYQLPVLEKISTNVITKIQIKGPGASIELNKKGGKWTISSEGYPAGEGHVKQILAVIEQPVLTALVSESENYDRYDLTDEKKIAVKAWVGDTLKREFDVGKAASSFKHTFVKLAGDHRVYHARDSFRFTFEGTVDSLRDKTVLDFEIKDIREIHVVDNGKKETFRRSVAQAQDTGKKAKDVGDQKSPGIQPVWKRSTGEKLDDTVVNRFLTTLDGLECDRYVYDLKKEDLKNPIYTLELKGTRNHTLSIFGPEGKEKEEYRAVSSDNAYPFELTKYRTEEIIKAFAAKEEKTGGS